MTGKPPSQQPDLAQARAEARAMGGPARIEQLHAKGKLTVRERLEILLDPGSFVEIGLHARSQYPGLRERTPADGTVVGSGRIDGRTVFVSADDPTIFAGTRGVVAEVKMTRARELALQERKPFILLSEAGAARVQESNGALSAGLGIGFEQHCRMSGLVPQVSVLMGASFGGPSFYAAQGDFTVLVEGTGFIGMSGPPVVKVGLGIDVGPADIGGPEMAARETGQVDAVAEDDAAALRVVRRYLSYFPSSSFGRPPAAAPRPAPCDTTEGAAALAGLVPSNQRRTYDALKLLELLVDEGSLFVLRPAYGTSLVTVLARMQGEVVGIVASNPRYMAGAIDDRAAIKSRRFVELCDAYHIPLLFFCDTPGFMVGPDYERRRMVSLCARLLNTLVRANVPKLTVVLRKAVGMAYIAMCGRACRPNLLVAWPGAYFDVMGPEAGVVLVHGRDLAQAADPEAKKQEYLAEFARNASALRTAELGLIDDVIAPAETRKVLLDALERVHGSEPSGFKHTVDP